MNGYSHYFLNNARLHRYGYQGQESDNEVKGEGNSVNYKYRMHDPRIGRFFAVDPLADKYPHYTPYSFSGNKLIHAIELEGLEEFIVIDNGNDYTIVWDITARDRRETGTIQYVSKAGDILQDTRPLNPSERASSWIQTRTKTPTKSSKVNHASKGTVHSGYRPSTGLYNSDGNILREVSGVNKGQLLPQPPVDDLKKDLESQKKKLSSNEKSKIEGSFKGGSIIGINTSGSSITPFVNQGIKSQQEITTQDIGNLLKGFEFSEVDLSLTLGTANRSMIFPTSPSNYASQLVSDMKSELVKAGVPAYKIKGSSKVDNKSYGIDVNMKIK